MYDHESLVKAIKLVDVVISAVGFMQLADQVKIIDAIKEAGTVKRFFPSEFGNNVDRVQAVEPVRTVVQTKVKIRKAVEAQGIPYTYVSANFFVGLVLPSMAQLGTSVPPRDKFIILGNGNPKGNELSGSEVSARVDVKQYAKEVIALKGLVTELFQNSSSPGKVVAPGGFFDKEWYSQLLLLSGPNIIDGVRHHIYNLGPGKHSSVEQLEHFEAE